MENIPILDKISKIIGNDENVPEFERLEMLSAIVHSKENYHRLKDKDALINKLLNDDNELMVAPSVKTFCKNSKHDVIVLGGLIEKLVYYNELPETLQACHTIVCYEDDELQKYKCRLIKLNHNNHVAFIKIYKNTKKQNIIDFTDLKLKEIELYFGEGKQYKRLGLPENSLDKYKKIELNNETKNFARDLNIYYLALQGNNDKDISALLELDYGFDFASIRRIISDINKLVKHNYLSNID